MGLESLFGDTINGKDGDVAVSSLENIECLSIYFSAHWCPPCRAFTPVLTDCYNAVNKDSKKWEVIFVSFDQTEEQFKDYYGTMPWITVPFDKEDLRQELGKGFQVSGIPALLMINPKDGTVILKDGRSKVTADPTGAQFDSWLK